MYRSNIELIYGGLVYQTRFSDAVNDVQIKLTEYPKNISDLLGFSKVIQKIDARFSTEPENAFLDLTDMIAYHSGIFDYLKVSDYSNVLTKMVLYSVEHHVKNEWLKYVNLEKLNQENVFLLESSNNNFSLSNDKDSFVYGASGNNILITGGGNDTLIGGTGNDMLNGGTGSDRYIFSKGHGQDTIYDYESSSIKDIDQVQFTDVASTDVKFRKEGNDLVLFGYSGDDSLRIQYFFYSSAYQVESFAFSDHQSLDGSYLNQYNNSANQMIDAMAGFHSTSDQLNTTEERTLKPVSLSTSSIQKFIYAEYRAI